MLSCTERQIAQECVNILSKPLQCASQVGIIRLDFAEKGDLDMPISEPTAVFSIRDDHDMEIKQAVLQVYRALEEKGYNGGAIAG